VCSSATDDGVFALLTRLFAAAAAAAVPRAIQDLHVPYVFPQECGGRADGHWLHLNPNKPQQQQQKEGSTAAAAAAAGLLIAANPSSNTLQMNLSPYSWQTLAAAKHQHELNPDPQGWHLHLDAAHMGVGGDDSWSPTVHEEYLLPPGKYQLGVVMKVVDRQGDMEGPNLGLYTAAKALAAAAAGTEAEHSAVQ